jgi:hypothetical protein
MKRTSEKCLPYIFSGLVRVHSNGLVVHGAYDVTTIENCPNGSNPAQDMDISHVSVLLTFLFLE